MAAAGREVARKPSKLAAEVLAVVFIAMAALVLLSLVGYDPKDQSLNSVGPTSRPHNLIGPVGAYISDLLLQMFGLAAFTMPALLVLIAVRMLFASHSGLPLRKVVGAVLLLIAFSGFLALFPDVDVNLLRNSRNGGAVGYIVEGALAHLMNTTGAAIVLTVASMLTLMLTMEISLISISTFLLAKLGSHKVRRSPAFESPRTRSGQRVFKRLSAWWARLAQLRRQRRQAAAEARRRKLEKEAELRRQREEFARREQELSESAAASLYETRSKAVPIQRAQEPTRTTAEDQKVLTPSDATRVNAEAIELAEGPTQVTQARRDALAALRARAAKLEQVSSASIDPDVAEMVSTASIVRTPTEKIETRQTKQQKVRATASTPGYVLPPVDLLEPPINHHEAAEEELRERAATLAEKCKEFAVTGHIHRINPGPVVTTFEFKPDPGIKYSRVVSLADDLCLALKAESIRIDRIPGKSTVGIEVPNTYREKIYLREVIESPRFQQSESKLTVALGKTINGEVYVTDLVKMPHLLIAGATGAGKSVTLNAIICSILFKASPDEVKFIMVDPKRVELGLYEGIPHLLTPIVTDPKRAANALKWATNEMETRYRKLAELGVRNIDQYNRVVREMRHPTLGEDGEVRKPLPYIVITIDELADLMMVSRGEVETSIARLAQMARAVGIHLAVATQRPSVDIITGVIKANIPSRIAFRVSSKVDSRTIIDSNGAEALLGQGDMLFLPPASARLVRVHGSFVNEAEIKRITDHIRQQAKPEYNEQVTMGDQEAEMPEELSDERDELYDEAVMIVTDMGRASTSVLQRRLSIGYGRAAKILDIMEREGFIGPADGAKPRKVLPAAYEFRKRIEQQIRMTNPPEPRQDGS
jgi:S-DNA-T family DNA segregation ATPase FtsK/SpoIIIE